MRSKHSGTSHPTEPSKLRASLDDDELLACPECDAAKVKASKHRSRPDGPPDTTWCCEACGADFVSPEVRTRHQNSPGQSGLAKRLLDADPAEVFGK